MKTTTHANQARTRVVAEARQFDRRRREYMARFGPHAHEFRAAENRRVIRPVAMARVVEEIED